jgi:hypothetical protein
MSELDILPAASEATQARERAAHEAVNAKRDEIERIEKQRGILAADLDEARRRRAAGIEESAVSLTGEAGANSRFMNVARAALGLAKAPTDAQSFEIAERGLELLSARLDRLRLELADRERARDRAVAEVLRERADRGAKLFGESLEWAGGLAREILNTRAAMAGFVRGALVAPHTPVYLNGCDVAGLTELLTEADWISRQTHFQAAAVARFSQLADDEPAAIAATR